MKPFLKFVGGKAKLAPRILELLPQRINGYFEPFVGGGAVFWALERTRFKGAFLSDINHELMTTYEVVRDNVEELIRVLGNMQKKHDKAFYAHVRDKDVCNLNEMQTAARMLYLNATCFNGLYRVNKQGKFNVPIGDYDHPAICKANVLRECSLGLVNVDLRYSDFEEALRTAGKGDAIYLDSPYVPLSTTSSFTAYGPNGFGMAEHVRLARVFKSLVERGVFVVLSNSDTPTVRELYHGYEMHEVQAARAINSKATSRGKIGELLIVGRRAP